MEWHFCGQFQSNHFEVAKPHHERLKEVIMFTINTYYIQNGIDGTTKRIFFSTRSLICIHSEFTNEYTTFYAPINSVDR